MFFRYTDIEFEYEEQYFNLGRLLYQPDFWLPKQNCWVEVKDRSPRAKKKRKLLGTRGLMSFLSLDVL